MVLGPTVLEAAPRRLVGEEKADCIAAVELALQINQADADIIIDFLLWSEISTSSLALVGHMSQTVNLQDR